MLVKLIKKKAFPSQKKTIDTVHQPKQNVHNWFLRLDRSQNNKTWIKVKLKLYIVESRSLVFSHQPKHNETRLQILREELLSRFKLFCGEKKRPQNNFNHKIKVGLHSIFVSLDSKHSTTDYIIRFGDFDFSNFSKNFQCTFPLNTFILRTFRSDRPSSNHRTKILVPTTEYYILHNHRKNVRRVRTSDVFF